jgi:hypothetical protein
MDVDAARQLLAQAPALLALLDEKSKLVETQAAQVAVSLHMLVVLACERSSPHGAPNWAVVALTMADKRCF